MALKHKISNNMDKFYFIDESGKVNSNWMARVKEVVDWIIYYNMYCIINVIMMENLEIGYLKELIQRINMIYYGHKQPMNLKIIMIIQFLNQ